MKQVTRRDSNQVRSSGQLLEDVFQLLVDILATSGFKIEEIDRAAKAVVSKSSGGTSIGSISDLGTLQRDCMEVICAWRRNSNFTTESGHARELTLEGERASFDALCRSTACQNSSRDILKALLDFGAVELTVKETVISKTPTFILGRCNDGGALAVDGVLKQVEGYLRIVHHNVCSVGGSRHPRFERSCSVFVAVELAPVFEQVVRAKGQEFIDSVDEWLLRNSGRPSPSGQYVELGAGAYFVDHGAC